MIRRVPACRLLVGAVALALASLAASGPRAAAGLQAPAASAAFDLDEATVADLQRRMGSGQETSRSIVEKYLARIDAVDRRGPSLHAIVETNPDALTIADRADAERTSARARGPLHGVPILIKDNIATADRMMTTAGSLALASVPSAKDASIVSRLRQAGAVLLGKTNLSEWANFRSTHASSGWSGRGGQAKNPYALDRSPSGSSSGSAIAVAANLAAVAIGTETDGSIVSPSGNTALVGIKPTLGLVSRSGIVPLAHSQDTAGPMARTVRDAAILLGVLAGTDPEDATTADADGKGRRDYTPFLDPNGLRGARLGVVRNRLFGLSPAADRIAEAAIAVMRQHGAIVVDPANVPTLGQFDDSELDVLLYEFKADLNAYLGRLGPASPIHSLADLIAFNDAHRDQELQYFGQEILTMAQKKGPLSEPAYREALAKNQRLSRTLGIDAVMTKYRLDALVAPTNGPAWLIDLVNGDGGTGVAPSPSTMAAVAGYPHITVPAGFVRGLPIGISFIGRAWSEPTLVKLAYAYEQATRHRRPPTFAPTADLGR